MIAKQPTTMAEVTRLTRVGRLGEAMALLQRGSAPLTQTPPARGPEAGATKASLASFPLPKLPKLPAIKGLMGRLAGDAAPKGRATPPAPAPGQTSVGGARFEERVFTNGFGRRTYKLYIPSGYAGQAMPLVVMLHGCQQSPDDFAAGTQMNRVAEELGLLVAYPQQSSAANQSRCWNWFLPRDQAREGGEPSLIAGITREVMEEVAVDPARVYVAGLSAGGAAAAIMGSAYPELYAAVCVHSGLACGAARDISSAFSAMQGGGAPPAGVAQPLPTIVFHGDRDHTVNMVNGDRVIAQSMGSSAYDETVSRGHSPGGTAYTRTVHADRSGHPVLEHWVLHGVGHAWSGGDASGSFTEPRGPDASREMMRFFLQQSRPADAAGR